MRAEIANDIMAGSFAVRQSKTILARSCEAESVSLCERMKSHLVKESGLQRPLSRVWRTSKSGRLKGRPLLVL